MYSDAKISVIIPVYNSFNTLEKAVNSIINQNYLNVEIILIDDGSTDDSGRLCDILSEKDNRIIVIHDKNNGPAVARNRGLDLSNGKYIYFMDSDDYLEPGLFFKIIPIMEKGYDMVVFNYEKVDSNGLVLSNSHFEEGDYYFFDCDQKMEFLLKKILRYRIGWELWDRIYRGDIIKKYNIRFPNEDYAEDLFFFLSYFACISKIKCIENKFYNYFIHENSLMDISSKQPTANLNKVNNLSFELKKFYSTLGMRTLYRSAHYKFLEQHINALYTDTWTIKDTSRYLKNGMDKSEFCMKEFKKFIKNSPLYYAFYEKKEILLYKTLLQYYCDGSRMKFRVRSFFNNLFYSNREVSNK